MRNLTIQRRKSFVGCAMKDQVYIQDENARELIIEGVPCRKLGDLKNGEQKTFQIEDGELRVFLIADKLSKEYCNGSVTIPAGQEDVSFSGKHAFVLGSNPFRFDGVSLSAEQIAKQKKNSRKGTVIFICAAVLGGAIGLFLQGGFFGVDVVEPKTFQKEDFQIILTDAFEATDLDGYFACYESKSALVFVLREEKTIFDGVTLEEYGQLVLDANGRDDLTTNKEDGFLWFTFTDTVEGQEVYYMTICCQSEEFFWIVNFATPETNREKFSETFMQWAKSVNVGRDSVAAA